MNEERKPTETMTPQEVATFLRKIRSVALKYVVRKGDKDSKPWHWHQDWTKAELLALGRELGFLSMPECRCYNPEARSKKGRIDVAWGRQTEAGFQPEVFIEICKGMPRRADIAKLSAQSGDVLRVAISLSRSKKVQDWRRRTTGWTKRRGRWKSLGRDRVTDPRASYRGLRVDRVWFIHYEEEPQLMSDWLGVKEVIEPLFGKEDGVTWW